MTHRNRFFIISFAVVISFAIVRGIVSFKPATSTVEANLHAASPVYLPVISYQTDLLCRYGVNGGTGVDFPSLGIGWYIDYTASDTPVRPQGTEYFPVIRLVQTSPTTYDYSPKGQSLLDAIAGNPKAHWLIGNEPDRRGFQDDIEPQLYAEAYHELYNLIKANDPEAQIIAGTIVQPTPVRLKYLDLVLSSYQQNYSQAMPVDGWSIHNFILNEVSCEYDPGNCWGAGIPPGIDDDFGEVLTIQQNDSIELFEERIVRFRQWMKDNGYGGDPLYLTEYGVLMPQDFGFDFARVNAFMSASFDYMSTAVDPQLGDPNDEYRLVQRWAWYSTTDTSFNGWLFDGATNTTTPYGDNYKNYTSAITREVDFYPSSISLTAVDADTYTVTATIANSGNRLDAISGYATVFIDDGVDEIQIGETELVSLPGCGSNQQISAEWDGVSPGSYTVIVRVNGNFDADLSNDELLENVTIP
ncbi:MAG: hypothetical protein QNJ45_07365 [Ardenticatenaceae bacterium]|nr:hypothetical protein [Ardenticatenaceae bacterium]